MENSDKRDSSFGSQVEQRVRKATKEDSTKRPVHELKRERIV